jgi:hypothetical protein
VQTGDLACALLTDSSDRVRALGVLHAVEAACDTTVRVVIDHVSSASARPPLNLQSTGGWQADVNRAAD